MSSTPDTQESTNSGVQKYYRCAHDGCEFVYPIDLGPKIMKLHETKKSLHESHYNEHASTCLTCKYNVRFKLWSDTRACDEIHCEHEGCFYFSIASRVTNQKQAVARHMLSACMHNYCPSSCSKCKELDETKEPRWLESKEILKNITLTVCRRITTKEHINRFLTCCDLDASQIDPQNVVYIPYVMDKKLKPPGKKRSIYHHHASIEERFASFKLTHEIQPEPLPKKRRKRKASKIDAKDDHRKMKKKKRNTTQKRKLVLTVEKDHNSKISIKLETSETLENSDESLIASSKTTQSFASSDFDYKKLQLAVQSSLDHVGATDFDQQKTIASHPMSYDIPKFETSPLEPMELTHSSVISDNKESLDALIGTLLGHFST